MYDNGADIDQYFVFDLTSDDNWQSAKTVLTAYVTGGGAAAD